MAEIMTDATRQAAAFAAALRWQHLPAEAVRIAKRCILDGLGLILAGSVQSCTPIVRAYALSSGGAEEATLFGKEPVKVPAPLAALVNGTAGHAMDWDDTQLSVSADRIYGLLTHPTQPPLAACLALAEKQGGVSGTRLLTAFLAGFEVECKIAEAIFPSHYQRGFHTSGTAGTFGATISAAKMLGLSQDRIRHAIGIAASLGSGIRTNFGTMTKPLHVGHAAQMGITAALLAQGRFEANPDALDGPWGFFKVLGGGFDAEKILGRLGNPHTIVMPGVSIKPYPCGVLTHPSMDALLKIVIKRDLKAEDIDRVVLYAGSNILEPIRYQTAADEFEAKFCMPFLLAAIIISRKAGTREFTTAYVRSSAVRELMARIRTQFDPDIEARGWDKIRSRVEVLLKNGEKIVQEADERYRGGPDNPLTDAELQGKFSDCTDQILAPEQQEAIFRIVADLERVESIDPLIRLARGEKMDL